MDKQHKLYYAFTLIANLLWVFTTQAQVVVTPATSPPFTPTNLINQIFLGDGVEVLSVNYVGANTAVGAFSNGQNIIGIPSGIVMTSGNVSLLNNTTNTNAGAGSDNFAPGDADLQSIAGVNTNNAAVYTIKFIPTADTLRFNYVFASEEYPNYVCSINDVFGFFINGPGITGPYSNMSANIALVPGTTTPVGVNTINNGNPGNPTCTPQNPSFYINNALTGFPQTAPFPFEFNGFTTVLTATAIVSPCDTYTIKLAIADAVDGILDSGVFLAANSFGTSGLTVQTNTPTFTTTIAEGCEPAEVVFRLSSTATANYPLTYTVAGSATMGVDYANIPLTGTIPAGQDSFAITLTALQDNISEGTETVIFYVNTTPCSADTFIVKIADAQIVAPSINDSIICFGDTVVIDATLPLAVSTGASFSNNTVFNFNNNNAAQSPISVSGLPLKSYLVGAIDSVCVNILHNRDEDVDIYLNAPTGEILELSTDNGGAGDNYTSTCFVLDTATRIVNGTAPFTGHFFPEGDWADLDGATLNGTWQLSVIDDQAGINGSLVSWSIHFAGIYNLAYEWTPTTNVTCPNCPVTGFFPDTTTMYHLKVTDTYGCISEDSALISVIPPLDTPQLNCAFVASNTITVDWANVPNNVGYQINIDNGGWLPLAANATNYTVNNLQENQAVQFQLRPLEATCPNQAIDTLVCTSVICSIAADPPSVTAVSCNGAADGSATVSVSNEIGSVFYFLNGITQANGNFTNLDTGNYQIMMEDSVNCRDTVNFTITQPSALLIDSVTFTPLVCHNDNSGTATVFPSGGTPNYTFQWSGAPSQTTATATNLAASLYTVTVTDAHNCTITSTVTPTQPPAMQAVIQGFDVFCNGDNSGKAFTTVTGGTMPYLYQWNTVPVQNTDTAFSLNVGTYTVTVTDANNCLATNTVMISEPNPLSVSMSSTPAVCWYSYDGTGTATVAGGVMPYSFRWDTIATPTTSGTQGGLNAGTHYVTITDINGCSISDSVLVAAPPAIVSTVIENPATCFGVYDGSVGVSATGGSGGFTYTWNTNPVQTGANLTNLFSANYLVSVTDAVGCTYIDTARIEGPVILSATKDSLPVTCFGGADGSVAVFPTGGTGAGTYSFEWNNDPSLNTSALTNRMAGTYSVYISDANGCARIDSMVVNTPPELFANLTMTPPDCFGFTNGTATAAPSGGTAGYVFNWENATSSNSITNLAAGDYFITVTDAQNCAIFDTITVTEPNLLTLATDTVATSCYGISDGQAWVVPSGGNTSFSYQWNTTPILTTDTIQNQPSGTYQVVVTDDKGCQETATVFIRQPDTLTVSLSEIPVSCFNGNNGQAIAQVMGGTSGYVYAWSVPQTSDVITNLTIGTYQVSVTDQMNCLATGAITVTEPPILALTMSQTMTSCYLGNDGTATVAVTGGKPDATGKYSFEWNTTPVQTDSIAINLTALQTYSVTVTDANLCTMTDTITIQHPPLLTSTTTFTPVICYGEPNGTATVTPSGGTLPYGYNWSTAVPQTDSQAVNLAAGKYYVTVTDANNCITLDSVTVTQPDSIDLAMDSTNISCYNFSDGKAWVTAVGGVGGFAYNWVGNSASSAIDTLNNVPIGLYTVFVTDANNCKDSMSVQLTQPDTLEFTLAADSVTCFGGNDGAILTTTTGGTGDYLYQWSNTTADTSGNYTLTAGLYVLTVTDAHNCISTDSIEIGEPLPFVLTLTQQPPTCYNGSDGLAAVTAAGGITPYQFIWNTSPVSADTIFNLTGGTFYYLTATDANGCSMTDSILVVNPDSLTLALSATDEACQQGNNGTATATVMGGFQPYHFAWDANANNQTLATATSLDSGLYSIIVTDALGCVVSGNVRIGLTSGIETRITPTHIACKNDATGSATAAGLTGTPPYTFLWDANANNQTDSTATNLVAGTYSVTVTDAVGCNQADQITLTEPAAALQLSIDSLQGVTCYGDKDGLVRFNGMGGTPPYRYQFNNRNYAYTTVWGNLSPGNYPIFVRDAKGCLDSQTVTIVEPLPFTVDLGADIFISETDVVTLFPMLNNGFSPFTYIWSPYDTATMTCNDCLTPSLVGLQNSTRFEIFATDSSGCSASDDILVTVNKALEIYVATGFTPNGNGTNETLFVQGNTSARVLSFAVFGRWGEKVFETKDAPLNDPTFGWDGRFKGDLMNIGTFGWVAEIQFSDGTRKVFKGNSTLIR